MPSSGVQKPNNAPHYDITIFSILQILTKYQASNRHTHKPGPLSHLRRPNI
jgi:hypothetical protein